MLPFGPNFFPTCLDCLVSLFGFLSFFSLLLLFGTGQAGAGGVAAGHRRTVRGRGGR